MTPPQAIPTDNALLMHSDSDRFRRRTLLRTIGLTALLIFCMLVGGYFAYDAMRESLDQVVEQNLDAISDANASALRHWIDSQEREVESWSGQEFVLELAGELRTLARNGAQIDALLASPAHAVLREYLEPVLVEEGYVGYLILDREGRVLSANGEPQIGRFVPADMMLHIARIFERTTYFSRPVPIAFSLTDPEDRTERPTIILGSVIANGGPTPEAALVFLLDPRHDFSKILSIGSFSRSGNTYAVDKDGRILSMIRFDEEVRRLGLLEENRSSVLNLYARDPGRRLRPDDPMPRVNSEWPLTRIVAAAVEKSEGLVLTNYRDYRGVPVYGAWKWFEDYDFGIITEMSVIEALTIIRPAGITVSILFALLIAAAIAAVVVYSGHFGAQTQLLRIRRLGQYQLIEKIGEGGIGTVYRATHAMLRRPTAIKLLRPDRITREDIARFEREVRQAAKLTHPNTIEIYDFGRSDEGIFYYAMEYLNGISLAHLIQIEQEVPPARVVHLLRQVCGSLHEAHAMSLIHRDIKPLNIFICRHGMIADFVKVLDFGLVKEILPDGDTFETRTDILVGTPEYIAPERIRDPSCRDPRSDLYSLGVVAYNLLTGREIYSGTSREILELALTTETPRPSRVARQPIPRELDDLVAALLSRNPADRPPTAHAVLERLDAVPLADRWGPEEAEAWYQAHIHLFHPPNSSNDQSA